MCEVKMGADMARFSANLGFLWTDLALPEGIRKAKAAGFDAVEVHFPYDVPAETVNAALDETGLPLLGLNTIRGNVEAGDFGLSAVPGRETDARKAIDMALDYAHATGCRNVHVMAGKGGDERTFLSNLAYAAYEARDIGVGVLIEPINHHDVEDYFLSSVEQAAEYVDLIGAPNLKIMFDCYHVQVMQGDLERRLEAHLPLIGHIQIAAAPSRAEPDEGEISYERLIPVIEAMGYDGFIGAEYRPRTTTDEGLGWMTAYSS